MWDGIESRSWKNLRDTRIAVLPVGSFEQHGPLPLFTDTLIAFEAAKEVARVLGAPLLPPVFYGLSREHRDFPLTVYLRTETFIALMRDVFSSLQGHGVKLLVVVNGHGGNLDALKAIIGEWNYDNEMKVFLIWPFDCVEIEDEWHAGFLESSIVAYLTGETYEGEGRLCDYMYPYFRTSECSESGSLYAGKFRSDPETGRRALEKMKKCSAEKAKRFVEHLRSSGVL